VVEVLQHGRPFSDFGEAIDRAKQRVKGFMKDRDRLGDDLLKKIVIHTLLMQRESDEAGFFEYLMGTHWFPETVDLCFQGEYQLKYGRL
jgi:hypothetical protein